MRVKNKRDFWSGVMFVLVGLFFALFAQNYEMGTPQRMGPAYFPTILGGLLAVLGAFIAFKALRVDAGEGEIEKFHFGPLAAVLVGVVAFGALLRPAGLVVALLAMMSIASLGSHEMKLKELVPLTVGLVLLVLAVFIWGLGLTIPVWPAFMNR
jgi:hypothetical protein